MVGLICVAAAVSAVILTAASTAGLAQLASFDGAYKGNIVCEQTMGSSATFRGALAIIASDGRRVTMSSDPVFDADGRKNGPPGVAAGIVRPDGGFRVGYTAYQRDATLHADYSGTFTATGGTLSGTEVWTRTTGDDVTRTCRGEFVRIEQPAR